MKILVIEDEKDLREVIRQSLEKEGYLVETAQNYNMALDKVIGYEYDCILLDIMLPDGSGLEILRELQSLGKTEGTIIISAKDSLEDKVEGLDLGADDYLTKPFHMAELNARVKSVLRRRSFNGKNEIELANLKIDIDSRSVFIAEREVTLNRKEYDILMYFAANKNRLITRTALAEHIWGDHMDQADDYEFIYSQIKNLRRKLKADQAELEIQTVYGIGYKLVLD